MNGKKKNGDSATPSECGAAKIMKHDELTGKIIGVFFDVYHELGSGFLESVYENAMAVALRDAGLTVEQQVPIAVYFRGRCVGEFGCDLLVNGKVLVELKAVKSITPEHVVQTLNYLKATDIEVALLFNFGEKPWFKRFVFDNQRKGPRMNTDKRG